jgi:type II secretion system protein N
MSPVLGLVGRLAAGIAWLGTTFVATWYFTFPSDAVAQYARWKVQEGGNYLLGIESVRPSGFGVRGDKVAIFAKERKGTVQLFSADSVRIGSGPLSVLRLATGGAGTVSGSISRDGGDIDFSVSMGRSEKGGLQPRSIDLDGAGLPIAALSTFTGGSSFSGTGGFDVAVDLDAPEGLSKAQGTFSLKAKDAVIEKVGLSGLSGFDLGPIHLSEMDISFDVDGGKAKISTGTLTSDLVQAEITGDVVLADELPRSRFRLKFVFTLGESLQQFKALLGSAAWEDGKFHYNLAGTFSSPRFRPERERRARNGGVGGGSPVSPEAMERSALGSPRIPAMDKMVPDVSVRSTPGSENAPDVEAARADRQSRREQAIAERRQRLQERRRELMDRNPIRPPGPEFADEPMDDRRDDDNDRRNDDYNNDPEPSYDQGPPSDEGEDLP